ncbi:MAG TPA: YdcF family protein [Cyanobacteria bacterium UBA11159]|nr:YdcF family protein [Cyanobacteria bacterium UBA11367]HBE60080.1 YdcF family protein [Cyanobacteria bacterium UBA11366]HBK64453.1 YdcF family protein [Cyanobacteria bacterium UBA11166]HBR76041.1 YdcF family protein [Cyanobacteria bacterium UBA11159]HBS69795.1 YdcF family protein [Cyanobacteria bacterium UBA11153]HCA97285.1 YdcF family protein [Cyanobacteria bacterium UBA9226]
MIISLLPTNLWTKFTWGVFSWLTTPWLVILPLLIIIAIPWLFHSPRWKRYLSKPLAILLLIYCLSTSPPIAFLAVRGLVSFLPPDSGATADAIVVLSRGELGASRYEVATNLWQANRAPQIFPIGKLDAFQIRKSLKNRGIAPKIISKKIIIYKQVCARTTEEEAEFTAAILGPKNVREIILITDPPHMLRSFLTFRRFGFSVIPHPSPLPQNLEAVKVTFLAFREYLGLVSYALLGRFQSSSSHQLQHPSAEVLSTLATGNCQEVGVNKPPSQK